MLKISALILKITSTLLAKIKQPKLNILIKKFSSFCPKAPKFNKKPKKILYSVYFCLNLGVKISVNS